MAVEEVIEMQGLSLDPTSHRVMTGENPLDMGPTEFKLFFMTHPERVYSREQLLNNVWGLTSMSKTGRLTSIFAACVKRWS
jgi:two-component system phosphate regulon response regulator PhoB